LPKYTTAADGKRIKIVDTLPDALDFDREVAKELAVERRFAPHATVGVEEKQQGLMLTKSAAQMKQQQQQALKAKGKDKNTNAEMTTASNRPTAAHLQFQQMFQDVKLPESSKNPVDDKTLGFFPPNKRDTS
ncbi:unnamed protein product, partial [Amoebophrya sp. A120]